MLRSSNSGTKTAENSRRCLWVYLAPPVRWNWHSLVDNRRINVYMCRHEKTLQILDSDPHPMDDRWLFWRTGIFKYSVHLCRTGGTSYTNACIDTIGIKMVLSNAVPTIIKSMSLKYCVFLERVSLYCLQHHVLNIVASISLTLNHWTQCEY